MSNTKSDPAQSQIHRFREIAKQLECDEDEAAFKEKLGVIARQKPKDDGKTLVPQSKQRK